MPHRTRPMTALLVFTGLNAVLVSTITPVYDFVCFLPYWERRPLSVSTMPFVIGRIRLAEIRNFPVGQLVGCLEGRVNEILEQFVRSIQKLLGLE
ncbi:hypothetical protein WN943_018667 [Citrus x changshan-huyou]